MRYISAAYAVTRCPSVCVCVSVTFVSCVKTNKDIIEIFSPSGSQAIRRVARGGGGMGKCPPPRRQQLKIFLSDQVRASEGQWKCDRYMYLKCTKMHHFVINLIKTTAHQMRIFSSISTRKRLAAGLRLNPLGELERSPRPPSRTKGACF